jgi:lysophospholipase L1-like esterase
VCVWTSLSFYFLLLYYPLPYHSHHIDKFLFLVMVILVWGIMFSVRPRDLSAFLDGRVYAAIRVGVVNVLIFVLAGEAVCRIVDPVFARSGLFGNKHSPANLKPHLPTVGSIQMTNSQGFRDRERMFDRTSSAPRLVALGDSFTYGAGVSYDEMFPTLLENALQRNAAGAEVINLGVSGWDPSEELHLLELYGVKFHPDVIILNFFVGNDIMRRRSPFLEEPMVVGGQSYYVHTTGNALHDRFGPDRWYLYHNLNYLLKVGGNRLRLSQDDVEKDPAGVWVPFRTRHAYLQDIDERSDIYLKRDTALFQYHWERTRRALERMHQFLQENGISLLIVLLPAQEQFDHDVQRELFAALGTIPEEYDFEKPQRILQAWGQAHGIPLVDLLPAFKQQPDPAKLYFSNDIHWTAAGHALASTHIIPMVERHLTTLHLLGSQATGTTDHLHKSTREYEDAGIQDAMMYSISDRER